MPVSFDPAVSDDTHSGFLPSQHILRFKYLNPAYSSCIHSMHLRILHPFL